MADIEALKYKHRLFKDGQMLITRRQHKSYDDHYCGGEYGETENIPTGTVLIVMSEGTTKAGTGFGAMTTHRSIKVLYTIDDVPRERKILFNPLYGPKEVGWTLFLSKEEFKKQN